MTDFECKEGVELSQLKEVFFCFFIVRDECVIGWLFCLIVEGDVLIYISKYRGREGREGGLGTQKKGLMLLCGEGRYCLIRLGKYM